MSPAMKAILKKARKIKEIHVSETTVIASHLLFYDLMYRIHCTLYICIMMMRKFTRKEHRIPNNRVQGTSSTLRLKHICIMLYIVCINEY